MARNICLKVEIADPVHSAAMTTFTQSASKNEPLFQKTASSIKKFSQCTDYTFWNLDFDPKMPKIYNPLKF